MGRLAVGGMAEVYQARPLPSTAPAAGEGPEVVLKRLLPAYRNDGAHVKHFIDEAKIAVRLQHKHLVRTFRCFKSGPDYLMVQELVPGRTLGYFLDLLIQAGTPVRTVSSNGTWASRTRGSRSSSLACPKRRRLATISQRTTPTA